jgi:hypothetical protein
MTTTLRLPARVLPRALTTTCIVLVAAGCGGGGVKGVADLAYFVALSVGPSNVAFAYDPLAPFPQTLGAVTFTNDRGTQTVALEIRPNGVFLSASPARAELRPGVSVSGTIFAQQCPPEPTTFDVVETTGVQTRTRTLTVVDQSRRQCLAPVATLFDAMLSTSVPNPFMETLSVSPLGVAVPHPSIRVPARVPSSPHTEIGSYGYFVGRPPQLPDGTPYFEIRIGGNGPSADDEEEYAVYWLATMGMIPLTSATLRYAGGFCVDADGDATNNYVPHANFMNDYGAGADRSYVLERKPTLGWSLAVTDMRSGGLTPVASRAVALLMTRAIALLVPLSELGGRARAYRAFVQEHDDDMGQDGVSPWSADCAPIVPQALRTVVY